MTVSLEHRLPSHLKVEPSWAARGRAEFDLGSWTGALLRTRGVERARLVSRSVPADSLRGEDLTHAACEVYLQALRELPGGPCRVWSFLPRPTERDSDTLDRYMRFNAGRTEAYARLSDRIQTMPAGTCVGHSGESLVVYALWLDGPIASIENPRQRPAWRYSHRFGPVPPAFSRAVRTENLLLASGTAAVVGEDSMHLDQLDAQFEETMRNLAALATAGGGDGSWRSVHVYVRNAADLERVQTLALHRFGDELERVLQAPICRRELLLEIEGICHAGNT